MFRFKIVISMLLLVPVGCGKGSGISQYEVDRDTAEFLTTDLLANEFDVIPFSWKVPSDWSEAENDQFSSMAWSVGPTDDAARITMSALSGGSGLEPQFVRWRTQLALPEVALTEVMKSVEDIKLAGATGKWCVYKNSDESILGMIVPHGNKLWTIKFRGSNAIAKQQTAAFRGFCESLKVE